MYAGEIVEQGTAEAVFEDPLHPYTAALAGCIPRGPSSERLTPIPGSVSDNLPWTSACAFAPRCSQPIERCRQQTPELVEEHGRALRCFNPVEVAR